VDGLPGYENSTWSGDCNPDGTIVLALAQDAVCTVVSDDIAPTLTLIKTIDGGSAVTTDFTLRVTGEGGGCGQDGSVGYVDPDGIAGIAVTPIESNCLYTISEDPVDDYALTGIVCLDGIGVNVGHPFSMHEGQSVTCTITNTLVNLGSITVVKQVNNNFGGALTAADFPLQVTATGTDCNVDGSNQVSPYVVDPPGDGCVYTITETLQPGYENEQIICEESGGTVTGATFSFTAAETWLCTVINSDLAATLTLIKEVVNDNGGAAGPDDWVLTADGSNSDDYSGTTTGFWSGGVSVKSGTYILTEENGPAGYDNGNWICSGGVQSGNSITLALGETAICTISNDDSRPGLTLVKEVINDNGGEAIPSQWTLTATGPTGFSGPGPTVSSGAEFQFGTYDLSESNGPGGYAGSDWICIGGTQVDGDTITLALGESATCTISNDDQEPALTLIKEVSNDNGGTALPSAWTLTATGPTPFSGNGPSVSNGEGFEAGSYDLSESGPAGYSAGDWICTGGTQDDADTVTLAPGDTATCTLTNDDMEPGLTLVKEVTNDNGGTALPSAWTLTATGPTPFSGSGPNVSNNPGFSAGTYHLSESSGLGGYTASDWSCVGGTQEDADTVTLDVGETAICTITNDDLTASLTVVKNIVNDNGGTVSNPNAFGLKIDDIPVANNIPVEKDAGAHTVSEDGLTGYQPGTWGGDCNPDGSITLDLGQDATCSITNDDISPRLTLVKNVTNDNGGSASADDWILRADGSGNNDFFGTMTGFWSGGVDVGPDTYILSESGGPGGYDAGTWTCSGGSHTGNTITLALGESATCSLSNNDRSPGLTLVKTVINDDGGAATASDWFLVATGPAGFSGPGPTVSNGAGFQSGTYDLSESGGTGGYTATDWVCTGGTQVDGDTVSLALGESATCTITNNDIAPTLKLVKTIVNDNGGTVSVPDDFGLMVDGEPVLHNAVNTLTAGSHSASEAGLPGYQAEGWGGDCATNGSITLDPGQNATCTLTNNDIEPQLTLVKEVRNDDGGSAMPSEWTLAASGPNSFSGPGPQVDNPPGFTAGTYVLSESGGPDGYLTSDWLCTGGLQQGTDTVIVMPGDNITCTIVNDDIAPTLTLVKSIINDNGGSVTNPDDFGLMVDGNPVQHNVTINLAAGGHSASEAGQPGYLGGDWEGDCAADGSIILDLGQDATCTLTNDDIEPGLTLVKEVINDNGGTAQPSAWTLTADGPSGFSGTGPSVSNGANFQAGTYDLSESGGPGGYVGGDWVCTGGTQDDADTVTLAPGDSATCTLTNDDTGPGLTLVKEVVNDNGGTELPSAWTLTATGPTGFSGSGPIVSSGEGFVAGTYDLSESGPEGYDAGDWNCEGGTQADGNTITLALGESATCTINNNDREPGLTLIKVVTNNNGGSALPSDWTLNASGPAGFSGSGPSVSNNPGFEAGTYDLSESGGPGGYSAGDWDCTGGTQEDADTITLALGETASCTLTNDDDEPGLTLIKQVTNNNGGTGQASNWNLAADGPTGFSGPGPSVSNGANFVAGTYNLSENGGPAGYAAGDWVCNGGTQNDANTITLSLGETATCTIVNDDIGPGLTLVKIVVNNNGGSGQPSDWILTADGPTGFSGPGPTVSNESGFEAGTYDLSESNGPDGYVASDWLCEGGLQVDADTITLAPGEAATCTITNEDQGFDPVIFRDGFESD
jgi:hypothetical protein